MPKVKKYIGLIPRIYKRQYEDIAMFFFIEAQRQIVPAVTIEQGICNFFRFCGINDFNLESSMTTYVRLKHEYYESTKTDK